MKIKLSYFYGIVAVAVIIVLVIVSQSNNESNLPEENNTSNQNIPDDQIHNELGNTNTPGKDNVSEDFKRRMDNLKNAVEENPKDTIKLKEYADMLAASHMQKQSVEYYKKLLSISPGRTDIMFSLSYVYYSLGDLSNAEEQTEQILEIEPENTNAMYNLGAIAASSGDKIKAKEIWQKLASVYPDEEIGIKALNSIKKLNRVNN
ncbi:tetratricopeptide repeat protein [Bacteroidota bacterium]